jgi:hypothetical protein
VGIDLYTAVTPDYSKSANGFTGTIDKIIIELEAMTPAGEDAAKKAGAESNEVEADQDGVPFRNSPQAGDVGSGCYKREAVAEWVLPASIRGMSGRLS